MRSVWRQGVAGEEVSGGTRISGGGGVTRGKEVKSVGDGVRRQGIVGINGCWQQGKGVRGGLVMINMVRRQRERGVKEW